MSAFRELTFDPSAKAPGGLDGTTFEQTDRYRDWWRRLRWRELPLPDSVDDADALARAAPGAIPGPVSWTCNQQ